MSERNYVAVGIVVADGLTKEEAYERALRMRRAGYRSECMTNEEAELRYPIDTFQNLREWLEGR